MLHFKMYSDYWRSIFPRVATYEQFMAFAEAGRKLADLHMNFENAEPYAGIKIEYTKEGAPSY